MNSKDSKVITAFEKLGRETVDAAVVSELHETIKGVFQQYPNQWFTQKDFVTVLSRQNGVINGHLRKLVDEAVIERTGSKRQYFYKLAKN